MSDEKKRCRKCGQWKIEIEFHLNLCKKDGLSIYCRKCTSIKDSKTIRSDKYRKRISDLNKTHKRKLIHFKSRMKRSYGLVIEQRNFLIEYQGGRCFICHKHLRYFRRFSEFEEKPYACVDHDSAVGNTPEAVRGILCSNCNTSIGALNHDVELLRRAIAYLTDPPGPRALAEYAERHGQTPDEREIADALFGGRDE